MIKYFFEFMYTNMLLDLFCMSVRIFTMVGQMYIVVHCYICLSFFMVGQMYIAVSIYIASICISMYITSLQVRCTQLGEENTVASDTEIPTRRREFLPSLTFLHVNRWRPVKQCLMRSPTQVNFVIYHLYKQVPLDFDCCIVTFSLQPLTHCFGHLLSDFCDRRKFN